MQREAVAAIGVANVQRLALHALALGHEQMDTVLAFADGEQCGWSLADTHLYADAPSGLAVEYCQRHQPHSILRHLPMPWAIVSPQHNIVVEVHGIRLREVSACTQQRHYLHGMRVLHLALAGHGDASRCEQRAGRNQRGNNVLVVACGSALVVIGHAAQPVLLHHTVQGHGSGGSMPQLVLRAERVDGECLSELIELLLHILGRHLVSQDLQLAHLHYFEVSAKGGG